MATAELAVAMPVLVMLLLMALVVVGIAGQRVRAQDAAREAARAAARGADGAATRLARQITPHARDISITRSGDELTAQVTVEVHPLTSWLPSITLTESAVAALEPAVDDGIPP
ncbi:MAG: pilus assembly protein [Actinomycetia bacterium]|nr:pilus assembly protein [Actinomycetes bacterium]